MAITTIDGLVAAARQTVLLQKTASRTSVASIPFGIFDQTGNPGAGTLAIGNTTNGVVPTDATTGYPLLNAFGSGATGYLACVDFGNTVACRMALYDTLFAAGAFAFNAAATLATIPSYSSRVPGGTDFTGTEIWIEAVTAFTGNQTISVGYTNQSGTASRSTGAIATGVAPTIGRMLRLPLQAGDSGVQVINTVTSTVSTVGTFNVYVLRPLWSGRVRAVNDGDVHGWDKTGLPQVWADSALRVIVTADSTATGLPELQLEIVNG